MTRGNFKNLHTIPKKAKPEHMSAFKVKATRVWDIIDSKKLIIIGELESLTSRDIVCKTLRLDNHISIDPRMSELYKFIALSFCCRLVWIEKLTRDNEVLKTLEIWGPKNLIPYVDIAIGYNHILSWKIRNHIRVKLKYRNEYLRRKSRETGQHIHTIDPRKQANDFYKAIIAICDEEVKGIYSSLHIGIISNEICRKSLKLVDSKLIEEGNLDYRKFVKRYQTKRIFHAMSTVKKFSKRRVLSKDEYEFNIFE